MTYRFILGGLLFSPALLLAGCDGAHAPESAQSATSERAAASSASAKAAANADLDQLARSLAISLSDVEVRRAVRRGVAERFGGAPEILYSSLKTRPAGGQTVRARIASANARLQSTTSAAADRVTEAGAALSPRVQVAVPVLSESWDAETYTPLVAVTPIGIDDVDVVQLRAYDASGRLHLLDATKTPSFPVIVVGLSERTDETGELLPEYTAAAAAPPPPGPQPPPPPSVLVRQGSHPETISQVNIHDDREPWNKEPAEIRYQFNAMNAPTAAVSAGIIPDFEPENQFHTLNRLLYYWDQNAYGGFEGVRWYEEDSQVTISFNISLTGTVTVAPGTTIAVTRGFTFNWTDGSDDMGTQAINYTDPLGAAYNTGYIEWKMQ